jgi:hypothetical protein
MNLPEKDIIKIRKKIIKMNRTYCIIIPKQMIDQKIINADNEYDIYIDLGSRSESIKNKKTE